MMMKKMNLIKQKMNIRKKRSSKKKYLNYDYNIRNKIEDEL